MTNPVFVTKTVTDEAKAKIIAEALVVLVHSSNVDLRDGFSVQAGNDEGTWDFTVTEAQAHVIDYWLGV